MSPYGWYQLARVHIDRAEPGQGAPNHHPAQRASSPAWAAQLERETGLTG